MAKSEEQQLEKKWMVFVMARMYVTLSDDYLDKFDKTCAENGMTRSNMFMVLYSSYLDTLPVSLRNKMLVDALSELNVLMKEILITGDFKYEDRMFITESVRKISELIKTKN